MRKRQKPRTSRPDLTDGTADQFLARRGVDADLVKIYHEAVSATLKEESSAFQRRRTRAALVRRSNNAE
jgi:hypothetical protein